MKEEWKINILFNWGLLVDGCSVANVLSEIFKLKQFKRFGTKQLRCWLIIENLQFVNNYSKVVYKNTDRIANVY